MMVTWCLACFHSFLWRWVLVLKIIVLVPEFYNMAISGSVNFLTLCFLSPKSTTAFIPYSV